MNNILSMEEKKREIRIKQRKELDNIFAEDEQLLKILEGDDVPTTLEEAEALVAVMHKSASNAKRTSELMHKLHGTEITSNPIFDAFN